jgi:hypothetical protein
VAGWVTTRRPTAPTGTVRNQKISTHGVYQMRARVKVQYPTTIHETMVGPVLVRVFLS